MATVQLGSLVFEIEPTGFSKTATKMAERRSRSIRGNLIKSGEPVVKWAFTLEGLTRSDFDDIMSEFEQAGFITFIPGADLWPDDPSATFSVSFNSFTDEQEGHDPRAYTIELEEQ